MSSPPTAIVLFGPPLPGRTAVARELARRLPGAVRVRAGHETFPIHRVTALLRERALPVIEGEFISRDGRRRARAALEGAGALGLFVCWLCERAAAAKEIFHRYASQPTRFARTYFRRWQQDHLRREDPGDEIPPGRLVSLGALPLREAVSQVAAALGGDVALAQRHPVSGHHVLVVDDDPLQRTLLGAVLEELGCRVHLAADAQAALVIAEATPLDLVITDEVMPGARGSELAAALARRRPELRVALLTGHQDRVAAGVVDDNGVTTVLTKPVRAADVIRLLDDLH